MNLDDRKKLAIAVHYEPSGVDPHINSAELGLQMTMGIFDTLVNKTPVGDYLPGLARAWEISADGLAYKFYLRKDVKFHDDSPFNASSVAFSLDRAVDPQNKSQLAGSMLGPYDHTEVLDQFTLVVHLKEPYALFLDSISQGWLAPLSPAAAARYGKDFGRHLVGTGPFVFDRWIPNDRIILRRNPDYGWAPPVVSNRGPSFIEELHFCFMPQENDRLAAFENGDVKAAYYLPPSDIARLRSIPGLDVMTDPICGVPVSMMMNIAQAPTDELAVRQAINYAVDQDALVQEVMHGEFSRAFGPLCQFGEGYEPEVESMYAVDHEKARMLLQQAGWHDKGDGGIRRKKGKELRVVFYALPVNYYPDFGRIIQRQLEPVGIGVDVMVVEPQEWMRAGREGKHHLIPQGKYASAPHILSYVYHSRHSQSGYGWSKRTSQHRPGLDALLEKGERALSRDEYLPIYHQVQKIVMEEALIAPLHCNTNVLGVYSNVTGWKFDAIGAYPYFQDVDIN